jgi:hypothetical protein
VRPGDREAVTGSLEALDYREKEVVENEVLFEKSASGGSMRFLVEIHFDLLNLLNFPHYARIENLDLERIWKRSVTKELGEAPIPILSPEDTLIYCCLHFFYHHNFRGLRYFSDIDAIVKAKGEPVDWSRLSAIASESRSRQKLFLILETYRRLFPGNGVPPDSLRRLSPSNLRARLFMKSLPAPEDIAFGKPGKSHHLPMILAMDRFRDMLYVTFFWFFPGKKFLLEYYRISEKNWRTRLHFKYAFTIFAKGFKRLF